ncbi:MAG: S-formylglutathione hydrolase [Pseudomonadota bacterium]
MPLDVVSEQRAFGGTQWVFQHVAPSVSCTMTFALFEPPAAERGPVPIVLWLSGLTCTHENFMTKAGAQRVAAELGIALLMPDTSPRGDGVPDDPDGGYDFGLGAGFYVDATEPPFDRHYRMRRYVEQDLPAALAERSSLDWQRLGVSGHSMGGHGALTLALREPDRYRSVSAFAPIANPMDCPWGQKALMGYLGGERDAWREYDACELVRRGARHEALLIDQGDADPFLEEQLKPDALLAAADHAGLAIELRRRPGYDHSYFYVASFIDEHLRWHAAHLT